MKFFDYILNHFWYIFSRPLCKSSEQNLKGVLNIFLVQFQQQAQHMLDNVDVLQGNNDLDRNNFDNLRGNNNGNRNFGQVSQPMNL